MRHLILIGSALALIGATAAAQDAEPENTPEAEAAIAEFDQLIANIGLDVQRVEKEADALVTADSGAEPGTRADPAATLPSQVASGSEATAAKPEAQIESAEIEDSEPNDSFGTAQAAAPAGSISGSIHPQRDADWYRVKVPVQGALRLESTEIPQDLDISFRVWNSEKATLTDWHGPLRVGGEVLATVDLAAPGEYAIEIRDGRDDAASTERYAFDLTFTPTEDPGEPNETFGTATPIAIGQPVRANILPQRDADFYLIEVPDQGELVVNIGEVAENLDVVFRIWGMEKEVLTGWQAPLRVGAPTDASIDLATKGRYVLEVRDGRDDGRSEQPYSMEVSFSPSGDTAEPNNSFGTATPLALGEARNATILPQRDADWFRVEIASPGELQVEITNVPPNLDLVYRVWNAEKSALTNWYAPLRAGGDTMGATEIGQLGSYYLEIRDGRDDERSVQPYSLRANIVGRGK